MTQVTGDWLTDKAVQRLFDVFEQSGHDLYCVGGCVRNALLGVPVSDVDMSSDAHPERVMHICGEAGLKTVPTGAEHGTITVISGVSSFEITTYRKDVETDGRRAVVAFSDRIEEDARRRDFTINALYATRTGAVLDPLDGLPDLRAGRIRFIDDPVQRIREDYLRILRFFRFHARFGKEAPDPETLAAIATQLDGLAHVSVERITAELVKLLAAPDPAAAVAMMAQTGVLVRVLPGADPAFLAPLVHVEDALGLAPDPLCRLAVLTSEAALDSLRLSNQQRRQIATLQDGAAAMLKPEALGASLGWEFARKAHAIRCALASAEPIQSDVDAIAWGASQTFPITAADLQPDYRGPALGKRLEHLRQAWYASGLTLTKDALRSVPEK